MTKAIVAAVAVGLLLNVIHVEASNPKPGLDKPKAEESRLMTIADAKEASPTFVDFFFHFNSRLIEWWQRLGRQEIRSSWQIFASEHIRPKHPHPDLIVIVIKTTDDDEMTFVKTALQKSIADYLDARPERIRPELVAAIAVISENGIALKSRFVPLHNDVQARLAGGVAAAAITRLLIDYTKNPASLRRFDSQP